MLLQPRAPQGCLDGVGATVKVADFVLGANCAQHVYVSPWPASETYAAHSRVPETRLNPPRL
jgi:hypothetical protein